MNTISEIIVQRIKDQGGSFLITDDINQYLKKGELEKIKEDVITVVETLFDCLIIDWEWDYRAQKMMDSIVTSLLINRFG